LSHLADPVRHPVTGRPQPAPPPAVRPRHYLLRCPACGQTVADDGLRLFCGREHAPAFLRTVYSSRRLTASPDDGLFRYRRWLPVVRSFPGAPGPVTFQATGLGRALGLADLWIAFNGYWPERGGLLRTATFKELEAYTVAGRIPERSPILVVPSVGNTAAAFASVFSRTGGSCVLILPGRGLGRLALDAPPPPSVRVVTIADGDYDDAIDLGRRLAGAPGFQPVGGGWNVARRDGLATVLLRAAEAMGRLPEFYVQAVGSAIGAIAVHEAAGRLLAGGGYGQRRPRLMICQNETCAPIHRRWAPGPGGGEPVTPAARRTGFRGVYADELTNQQPPYLVRGGIRDVLRESAGRVLVAGAAAARAAADLFARTEGADIEPAASVAVACLAQAAARGQVPAGACVLLNITGGGRALLARTRPAWQATPDLRLTVTEAADDLALTRIAELFGLDMTAFDSPEPHPMATIWQSRQP
jgi:cysteate synthase